MSALLAGRPDAPVDTRAWLRSIGRPGAERWIWVVAAAAWAALAGLALVEVVAPGISPHHPAATPGGLAAALGWWLVMVAAVMLPLIAPNLRRVGRRSAAGRGRAATVAVVAGWSAVWLTVGLVVVPALSVLEAVAAPGTAVAVAAAAALGWQCTPTRRLAVARCHRALAPPLGAGATRACLRFGLALGRDGALSCVGAMVVMAAVGHALVPVVLLGWLAWRDVRRPHDRPADVSSMIVIGVVAAVAVAFQI